jgi:PAS domain S-box-containing protein
VPGDPVQTPDRVPHGTSHASAYVQEALRWLPSDTTGTLSADLPAGQDIFAAPRSERPAPTTQGAARIIIADDNSDMRDYLARLLRVRYAVTAVGNGEEALRAALDDPPDLVLADVMMPVLDGFGLLEQLRAHPRTTTIPVILLSARAGEQSTIGGLVAGADDYLIKPFTARELIAPVDAHLALQRHRRAANETVERSVAKLRLITDSLPTLISFVGQDFCYQSANKTYEKWFGIPQAGLVGKSVREVLGESAFETLRPHMERALSGETVSYQGWIPYRTGGRHIRATYVPEFGIDRRVTGFAVLVEDNTEATISAEARRVSEGRLTLALEAADMVAWEWDPVKNERVSAGQLGKIYGSSVKRAEDGVALLHPDDAVSHRSVVENAVATGGSYLSEFRIIRPEDGVVVWLEERARTISDEAGQLRKMVGVVSDVTTRKRAEKALQESEERFRVMADHSPVMIWVTEPDGRCSFLNRAWFEFTGQSHRDALGFGWLEAVHPEDRDIARRILRPTASQQETFRIEYRIRHHDGEWRWAIDAAAPSYAADGAFLGCIGSIIDITDRKKMEDALRESETRLLLSNEELRRVNSDLEQFAYSASHDLREPLRNIGIYSQLLTKRYGPRLDEQGLEFLAYLQNGAARMEMLVEGLLAYTRVGSAGADTGTTCDANRALADALADLMEAIRETQTIVTCDTLPTVNVRCAHLEQVFQNLVGNAIQYRGELAPRVHLSAQRNDRGWVFAVRDNGIGIDHEYKERIFGIFKQLHTADKYSGTGMGLAICQRIVERYGGRIWVESEPGAGSAFFFNIPD